MPRQQICCELVHSQCIFSITENSYIDVIRLGFSVSNRYVKKIIVGQHKHLSFELAMRDLLFLLNECVNEFYAMIPKYVAASVTLSSTNLIFLQLLNLNCFTFQTCENFQAAISSLCIICAVISLQNFKIVNFKKMNLHFIFFTSIPTD